MWTRAGTLSPLPCVRGGAIALGLALLLAGCGSAHSIAQPVLPAKCMRIDGHRDSSISLLAPADGWLRLRIEQRGISVVATLDGNPLSAAESPIERLGTIHLVKYVKQGERHSLTVQVQDSPDIAGEYCLRSELLVAASHNAITAETSLAAADRATHAHEWKTAFEQYLNAAWLFDTQARASSAAARHSMAEIAYLRFDNKRDSYALASQALADYGPDTRPIVVGALIGLQAKALLDMPGMDAHEVAGRARRLQDAARVRYRAEEIGERELPRLQIMSGFLEYRLDSPAKARAAFSSAAQTCRALRDWDCYAIAGQNLALAEYESKNYTSALSAFADVLRLLPPGLDPKLAADIWNNYGSVQGLVGLYSSSQRSHETAMREYAQLGDCQGVRRNLARSGNLMAQLGTLTDAMNDLQQAASLDCTDLLATATGGSLPEGRPIPVIDKHLHPDLPAGPKSGSGAWCTHSLDPTDLATDNKTIVFNSLASLGDALMLEGESAVAQRCLEAAGKYAATARTRMRLANSRGEVLLETRDAAGAATAFKEAIRIADEAKIPPAHEYRGAAQLGIVKSALLAGEADKALRGGFAALTASVGRGDIDQTVASLRLLAAGYLGQQQHEQAARTLHTAVDLIEAVPIDELDGEKRATYLATQYNVFAELTDLYASRSDADPAFASMAFATSERGRARGLRYAVTQAERDASFPQTLPAATRYQRLLGEVVNLTDAPTDSAGSQLIDQLDAAALREHTTDDLLDQQQLQLTLNQLHATLIEYAVGTRDMFAFVVNEGGLHIVRLGDRKNITSAAADLHDRLLDPEAPQSEVSESARRLAELMLWPLTPHLSGKRLVFVPDDGLHTVPFNVLPWSANPADLLVLQHAEVAIEPSALFLTRMHTAAPEHIHSSPRIELLGDPVFRIADWAKECTEAQERQVSASVTRTMSDWTESLPRLPGSRAEVQMVARLTQQSRPASHVEILLGCAAVPSALRKGAAGHVDLLHIATHARVDSQRPRLSALALTPEHKVDGTASAFGLLDILGLKLTSSLVVLSACETSRGRLLPGEGVLGPAQAFLQAGAGAVVASYWRVDDLTTSRFMEEFYRYLLTERLPAATALRKAQIAAAANGSAHNWAAFSVYGWPDSSI